MDHLRSVFLWTLVLSFREIFLKSPNVNFCKTARSSLYLFACVYKEYLWVAQAIDKRIILCLHCRRCFELSWKPVHHHGFQFCISIRCKCIRDDCFVELECNLFICDRCVCVLRNSKVDSDCWFFFCCGSNHFTFKWASRFKYLESFKREISGDQFCNFCRNDVVFEYCCSETF